jgi:endonuclease/exonuclease/phosphatase family metal-dependent hydrolase
MRLITWNMGCAYGSRYKQSNPRTWQQLLAWQPDIALVQETLHPGDHLDPETFLFTRTGGAPTWAGRLARWSTPAPAACNRWRRPAGSCRRCRGR